MLRSSSIRNGVHTDFEAYVGVVQRYDKKINSGYIGLKNDQKETFSKSLFFTEAEILSSPLR